MYRFICLIITIFCLISTSALAKGKDEAPNSKLSVSDIKSYIEQERPLLRGKFKVSLAKRFLRESGIRKERYGNVTTTLNLKGLSFSGMDLSNISFNLANMTDTNLKGANLSNSDLISVDFTGADLRNTDFKNADLSNAHFENTDIEGTNFEGANLFNATFNKVTGVDTKQLEYLKSRTTSYVNMDREALPDYYNEEENDDVKDNIKD